MSLTGIKLEVSFSFRSLISSLLKATYKQQEQDTKGLQTPSLQQLLVVLASFLAEDLQQAFSQFSLVSFFKTQTLATKG